MKCIALYHVRFEDLGSFAEPLRQAGFDISYRHAGSAPLSHDEWRDTDLVVVLGGPLGAGDSARYPWLQEEIAGLALRLSLQRPTLGICLGAQMMAVALGGRVERRSGGPEIGWSPLSVAGPDSAFGALDGVPVLHWHGDNIVLPPGIASGAATDGTPVQGFQLGSYALGIQFHAEFQPAALEEWLSGHAVELAHAGIDLAQLRQDTRQHGEALLRSGQAVLAGWLAGIGDGAADKLQVLFHDGCSVCLGIAASLALSMPGLTVIDLGLRPELKDAAMMRGVSVLPSLVLGATVIPVTPHSDIGDIGASHH
jgi:GMP synthase (glutamine-hydrolysing)